MAAGLRKGVADTTSPLRTITSTGVSRILATSNSGPAFRTILTVFDSVGCGNPPSFHIITVGRSGGRSVISSAQSRQLRQSELIRRRRVVAAVTSTGHPRGTCRPSKCSNRFGVRGRSPVSSAETRVSRLAVTNASTTTMRARAISAEISNPLMRAHSPSS